MSPSQSDMSLAVDYLDGSMTENERIAFEARLAGDSELAEAVEVLFETDELIRRVRPSGGAAKTQTGRLLRFPGPWMARGIAAAALVLIIAGLRFFAGGSADSGFSVALVESWRTGREFADNTPGLAGMKAPGLQRLRSVPEEANCTAEEFRAAAASLDGSVALTARGEEAEEITAGHFVVPIEVSADSTVVVLAIPKKNVAPMRLFPEQSDVRSPAEQGRILAGRHVLPAERVEVVELSGESQVAYRPGFLVPLDVGSMDVLVGVSEEPFEGDTLGKLDAALATPEGNDPAAEVQRLTGVLEASGFSVAVRRVVEPNE